MILNLGIDTKTFENDLAWEIVTGGLTIVDAIERLLCEHMEASIATSLGSRLVKSPQAFVHPRYYANRFENLFNLSQSGYSTWYPEVRFSTKKSETFEIAQVETSGLSHGYAKFGGEVEQRIQYRRKDLKTQVNHSIRLTKLSVPASVFSQAFLVADRGSTIEQPFVANLTVGFKSFVDDRIEGFRVVSFDHVVTGERKFCRCHFKAHTSMLSEAKKLAPSFSSGSWPHCVIELLESATYEDSLCHFCVAIEHGEDALSEWYGDQIQQHCEPYIDLLVRGFGLDIRTAKSEARRRLSISRWVREDELYRLITRFFPTMTIRREASPRWLGRQRLDIYLPELSLAIEHQGEQHFRPVEAFGGEQAWKKVQERDKRKRRLCHENGVTVAYVRFDDPLTYSSLRSRFRRWLL